MSCKIVPEKLSVSRNTIKNDFLEKQIKYEIVVFLLDDYKYAIPLHSVSRIINAVDIRPLSGGPEIISGIINMKGKIIPVVNIRKRLGLEQREIEPEDRFIITYTGNREIAFPADSVPGLTSIDLFKPEELSDPLPDTGYLIGIGKTDNGIILIYDMEKFLSAGEENKLKNALEKKKR